MVKKGIQCALLKSVERMSRREALGCRVDSGSPWPHCTFILHQPKRPKNDNKQGDA